MECVTLTFSGEHTSLFVRNTHQWVGKEYSTKVSKQNWTDVPKDVSKALDSLVTYNPSVVTPRKLARRMIEHAVSVDDFRSFMTWILEHSTHTFTYYYPHDTHGKRWRMSKKPFVIKPFNYSAKGLASTIQSNRFFVNAEVFDGGAVNASNVFWNEFNSSVLGFLPAMRMSQLKKQDVAVIEELSNTNHNLCKHVKNVDKKIANLEVNLQKMVTRVFNEIDDLSYLGYTNSYDLDKLLKVDDMKQHMDEHMLGDASDIHFKENKAKVAEANTQMRRHVADVFRQRQAKAELMAEFYRNNPQLNPNPNTQEEEE